MVREERGISAPPNVRSKPRMDKSAWRKYVTTVVTENLMKTVQLRDAKARLSALIDAAESGEPTTITRHGKPAAVIVPLAAARKIYPTGKPSFADWLLSIPGELPYERDRTPPREVEF